MLHQIELYRSIPKIQDALSGFIDESNGRLFDLAKSDYRLRSKYAYRVKSAKEAIKKLSTVWETLHE